MTYDTDPDELTLSAARAKRKAAHSKWGWLTALVTASASIIGQLLQVRASDAEKLQLISAGVSIETKIEALRQEVNQLSNRITKVETELNERTQRR